MRLASIGTATDRSRRFAIALACFAASGALAAPSDAAPFDGRWNVTLTCPPHHEEDDAKGYTHRFPAEVAGGQLRATHGQEGEPSWHLLTGRIAPDGTADLKFDGIVKNPDYAIKNAQRGKPYTYRVRATFDASSGTGARVGGRKCFFRFERA